MPNLVKSSYLSAGKTTRITRNSDLRAFAGFLRVNLVVGLAFIDRITRKPTKTRNQAAKTRNNPQ